MADLLTFEFNGRRRLIHAGEVGPALSAEGWGRYHVALTLLCGTGRGIIAWTGNSPATLDNVTCPRCRSRLARVTSSGAEGR